jgi:hypothetical protein
MKRLAAREIARITIESAQYEVLEMPPDTESSPIQGTSPEKHPLKNRKDAYIEEGGPMENAGMNYGLAMARK